MYTSVVPIPEILVVSVLPWQCMQTGGRVRDDIMWDAGVVRLGENPLCWTPGLPTGLLTSAREGKDIVAVQLVGWVEREGEEKLCVSEGCVCVCWSGAPAVGLECVPHCTTTTLHHGYHYSVITSL